MSTDKLMREGLFHKHMATKDSEFFALIDATGGWPVGYKFVGFEHTTERAAGYCNSPHNNGWWTVIASADDYYLWKLSPEALQKIANAVVSEIRLTKVDANNISVKNFRGYKSALSGGVKA
ncbi:hypothetical protein [Xanthomonas sp. LMG 12461]|uniref:hypothetical protein n=1 Tax=Xanthomonas sp. LMG 12461 TaxID=2014543 RepID=UPI001264167E|nr:hypothetical protein [Xanthomonas sp. LMG 12461]